jgi:hypothetical protein
MYTPADLSKAIIADLETLASKWKNIANTTIPDNPEPSTAKGEQVPPLPYDPSGEAPAPVSPTVDLADVATAYPEEAPATTAANAAAAADVETRLNTLEGQIGQILAAVTKAVTK